MRSYQAVSGTLRAICSILFVIGVMALSGPSFAGMTSEQLNNYYLKNFPPPSESKCGEVLGRYPRELLAKAQQDECFNGIGQPAGPGVPPCTEGGASKVNQSYVFGLAQADSKLWFGTSANQFCTVVGSFLATLVGPENLPPMLFDSMVCEFGMNVENQGVSPALGDWRLPQVWMYDTVQKRNISKTAEITDQDLLSETLGMRSAGAHGGVVFLGGPNMDSGFLGGTTKAVAEPGIILFAFNADTRQYIGAKKFTQYVDIRKWIVADGNLYTAVKTNLSAIMGDQAAVKASIPQGKVLRWIGSVDDPFQFEEVGILDGEGAELAYHEDRLVVTTWTDPFIGVEAGVWASRKLGGNPLTAADQNGWTKIFTAGDYEPDPLTARAYWMGAAASYGDWLYFGTLNFPFLSFATHMTAYQHQTAEDILMSFIGSWRNISIFRAKNLGGPDQQIELLSGMPVFPVYNAETGWDLAPNNMGVVPSHGPSGYGNLFNAYTWAMGVYNDELFVGTFDWSYIAWELGATYLAPILGEAVQDAEAFIQQFLNPELKNAGLEGVTPEDVFQIMTYFMGADLFTYPTPDHLPVPESISGIGNYANYGIRTMLSDERIGLILGSANPMNLLADETDEYPEGGWELLRMGEPVADDGDSVTDEMEDAAPNEGDGNGDGEPDKNQYSVASFPSAEQPDVYITVELDEGAACNQVASAEAAAAPTDDPLYHYPVGLVSFSVDCITPGQTVEVAIYYHTDFDIENAVYRKFGIAPDAPDKGERWYTFESVVFGRKQLVENGPLVPYAIITITDNQAGDNLPLEAIIDDPGGPAIYVPPAPEIEVSESGSDVPDNDGSVDYGTTTVGNPITKTFTISNTGNAVLPLSTPSLPDGFSRIGTFPSSIAAGGSDTFQVRLDADAAGDFSGRLSFANNDDDEDPYDFAIAGVVNVPPAPETEVSESGTDVPDNDGSVDYGTTTVGNPVTKTFTISNTGNAELTVSAPSIPDGFSLVGTFPASIAAGGSDTFQVRLDADTAGSFSGRLSFANNDDDENPYDFAIQGTVQAVVIPTVDLWGVAGLALLLFLFAALKRRRG